MQWGRKRGQIEKVASVCRDIYIYIYIYIHILSGVRWIASEKLLCRTGNPFWCSMMTWRDGIGVEEGMVVCIIMADLHCMAETNSTVKFFFKFTYTLWR